MAYSSVKAMLNVSRQNNQPLWLSLIHISACSQSIMASKPRIYPLATASSIIVATWAGVLPIIAAISSTGRRAFFSRICSNSSIIQKLPYLFCFTVCRRAKFLPASGP